jgi:hypothetical protein
MSQVLHSCPDCHAERLFEQYHAADGTCPDSADGICPEWSCTGCGAALITGWLPNPAENPQVRDIPSQVA